MATTVITDALVILSTDPHGRVETSDAIAIDGNRIVAVGDAAPEHSRSAFTGWRRES